MRSETTQRAEAEEATPAPIQAANVSALRRLLAATARMLLPALLAALIVLPVRSAVADWNDVPSASMWPTILEGDRIYVDKLAYGLRIPFTTTWIAEWNGPERGDVVTFASPKDGIRMVKRIVGIPGDRLSMRDNQLTVNGEVVRYADEEPVGRVSPTGQQMVVANESLPPDCTHSVALTPGTWGIHTFDEIVVPDGHYFFLGDNRDQSFDSRFIGLVPRSDVYGRVRAIALSVDPENSYLPRFDRWFTTIR